MSTTQQEQTRAAAPQEYLLEMRGITKAFAGVQALKGVDFYVRPGTVHALMGENGAGKSTLMKCLFGIYHKDEGIIKLRGQEVNFQSPHEALLNGISMVHQELEQVPERSVMENVWLGRFPKKFGLIDTAKMIKDTEAVLATLGGEVKIDPRARLSSLTVSKRQMVDIAKAVSYNCDIIALDEPTSSLNEKEVDILMEIIDGLRRQPCLDRVPVQRWQNTPQLCAGPHGPLPAGRKPGQRQYHGVCHRRGWPPDKTRELCVRIAGLYPFLQKDRVLSESEEHYVYHRKTERIKPHRNRALYPCAAHCQEGKGRPVYHCPRKGGLRAHPPDHRRV